MAATAVIVPITLRVLRDDDAVAADLEHDLRGRSDAPLTVIRTANGAAVRSVGTRAGSPIRVGGTDPAGTFLDRYGRLLGADRADLVPISDEPTLGGGTATRYQQTIDDVPVLGGELSVQVDADGGVLSSLADLSRGGSDIDMTPAVRPVDARRAAVAATARAVEADPSTLSASAPEPWIYDPAVIGPPSAVVAPPDLAGRGHLDDRRRPPTRAGGRRGGHDRPLVQPAGPRPRTQGVRRGQHPSGPALHRPVRPGRGPAPPQPHHQSGHGERGRPRLRLLGRHLQLLRLPVRAGRHRRRRGPDPVQGAVLQDRPRHAVSLRQRLLERPAGHLRPGLRPGRRRGRPRADPRGHRTHGEPLLLVPVRRHQRVHVGRVRRVRRPDRRPGRRHRRGQVAGGRGPHRPRRCAPCPTPVPSATRTG